MKANKNYNQTKSILLGIMAIFTMLLVFSCAKKSVATAKAETPAAMPVATDATVVMPAEKKGQVQIKRDVNSNYVILINLRELEGDNKIEPATKKAYIVWINADNKMVKNLGQINSNSGWLSDKSKASFEATSDLKPTQVFITEEETASVTKPSAKIVWSTNKF